VLPGNGKRKGDRRVKGGENGDGKGKIGEEVKWSRGRKRYRRRGGWLGRQNALGREMGL